MSITADHERTDHEVAGSPYEQMRGIMARRLCGWISGHSGPIDHFLGDADLILAEAHAHGLRYHLAEQSGSSNSADGFIELTTR